MTWCAMTGVVVLSLMPWLGDVASDLKVATDHYLAGDRVWFSLTLLFGTRSIDANVTGLLLLPQTRCNKVADPSRISTWCTETVS